MGAEDQNFRRQRKREIVCFDRKAALDAITYIRKLPEPAQDSAGSVWADGMNTVVAFFEELYKGLQAVAQAVVDFFKGIWDQITKSWNAVVAAAQASISFITGVVPFSVPSVWHAFLPISASLGHVQDQVVSYLRQLSSTGTAFSRLVISKQVQGWKSIFSNVALLTRGQFCLRYYPDSHFDSTSTSRLFTTQPFFSFCFFSCLVRNACSTTWLTLLA